MAAMDFCWELGDLHEAHQEYLREYNPPKLERRQDNNAKEMQT
jgi:hypothetical protein